MRIPQPAYPSKPHSSGQARIKIRGKAIYLGPFGSPASKAKYHRIIAEQCALGGATSPADGHSNSNGSTVSELLAAFWQWATLRYVKNGRPTSEIQLFEMALAPVESLYSDTLANAFGPLALMACRNELLKAGYCRNKINEHVGRIRRVWKWGVSREMVRTEVWMALRAVEGLRKGEAIDRPKVTVVNPDHIAAIEAFVLPPIWAMVQLQLWTGMRPGEATQMRTCDISANSAELPASVADLCWVYRPQSHKTEHHERSRLILLGPQAQEVLRTWMQPEKPEAFMFSPKEAVEYSHAKRVAAAKNHNKSHVRKRSPKKKPGIVYSPHAYAHAIAVACKKAGIPRWSPNRLRHNAATLIRQRYGVEVARIILGHANIKTTEVYAELDLEKAARAIAQAG